MKITHLLATMPLPKTLPHLTICFSALLMLYSAHSMAFSQATVHNTQISIQDTFTLSIQTDQDIDSAPDISPLRQTFEVLNQQQQSQISFVNGHMSRQKTWRWLLAPKASGTLHIPAFIVGKEHTAPITLRVLEQSASTQTTNTPQLALTLSPEGPLLPQQQAVLTVRLTSPTPLLNGHFDEPVINHVEIRRLGQPKQHHQYHNGQEITVVEQRFALFPQQPGELTVPPFSFTGTVATSRTQSNDPFSTMLGLGDDPLALLGPRGKTLHIRSPSLHRKVLQIPEHGNAPWLPARSLTLRQRWQPELPHFQVGQAVTRTLSLLANGLTAEQIPGLTLPQVPGVKVYPDPVQRRTTEDAQGVKGSYTIQMALVPQHAGVLELPAMDIPWWDTQTHTLRHAQLPLQRIVVQPASQPTATNTANSSSPSLTPKKANTAKKMPTVLEKPTYPNLWIGLLAGGWLLTLLAWWRHSHTLRSRSRQAAHDTTPANEKQAWKQLLACCRHSSKQDILQALLLWSRYQTPKACHSLSAMARYFDAPLHNELLHLEACCYRDGAIDEEFRERLSKALTALANMPQTALGRPTTQTQLYR